MRKLFKRSQEAIDWLNKVISESILGSALIRLLNSQKHEDKKFLAANTEAKKISFEIFIIGVNYIKKPIKKEKPIADINLDDNSGNMPW